MAEIVSVRATGPQHRSGAARGYLVTYGDGSDVACSNHIEDPVFQDVMRFLHSGGSVTHWSEHEAQWRGQIVPEAQRRLSDTDVVFARFGKAGVPWPDEWRDYWLDLQAIRRAEPGDPEQVQWPQRPAVPDGI